MRRIDVIGIGVGVLLASGLVYGVLQVVGFNATDAGIWTQALLVVGLLGWLMTYILRAVTGSMTYHQQRQEYEEAVLQKRLEELSPEELAALQAEIAMEQSASEASE